MKEAGKALFDYIISRTEFNEVMGDNLFPLVVAAGNSFPFSTYRIEEESQESKDDRKFTFSLMGWFGPEQYDEMLDFLDSMKIVIEESGSYEWVSSNPDFIEENQSFVGIINFNTI